MNKIVFLILISSMLHGDNFILPSRKKPTKITPEDCCEFIGNEMKFHSRILQYTGAIQEKDITMIDDVAEGDKKSSLKKAKQQKLHEYRLHEKEFIKQQEDYLNALQEHLKYLQEFEKEIK
jgi:hypothetical protein